MSKTGKNPIALPEGTTAELSSNVLKVAGKLGKAEYEISSSVLVTLENKVLTVKPANDTKVSKMMWGTTRSHINNVVIGVSAGFTRTLDMVGVGYRASMQGETLVMLLGFSHDIQFVPPKGIKIQVENQTKIIVTGVDKELVGKVSAKIRSYRKPEPYKGKGVKYSDEVIIRKEKKK